MTDQQKQEPADHHGVCAKHGPFTRGDVLACPVCQAIRDAGLGDPNPKHAAGSAKTGITHVPLPVLAEVEQAMREGAEKYGSHNWREAGARGSVYVDAAWRHLSAWWEGEDIDPDSGIDHISKAIASLFVLRDAMIQQKLEDDRPPMSAPGWQELG